jgi:hypothetical protein
MCVLLVYSVYSVHIITFIKAPILVIDRSNTVVSIPSYYNVYYYVLLCVIMYYYVYYYVLLCVLCICIITFCKTLFFAHGFILVAYTLLSN